MYPVEIDTTQNISGQTQLQLIVRYVKEQHVKECLLALPSCKDLGGKGLMKSVKTLPEMNKIDLSKCIGNSTNGADNIKRTYNRLTARLSEHSP